MIRTVNQAKLKSFRHSPMYKFGVQVPRNHEEAMELDRRDGENLWARAEARELNQIDEYITFTNLGKGVHPKVHKKIRVHMVYDVEEKSQVSCWWTPDTHTNTQCLLKRGIVAWT